MAIEIPIDLINQLKISLRREAKLFSYDPDDHSIPDLPSFKDSIPEVDPSPPYLRCSNCKGRLLRGEESLVCVFCGQQQRAKENPPDPIKFTATCGYSWFLRSLNLDGSETVALSVEASESKRDKAPHEQIPLSQLLDLEVQWCPKEEKPSPSISEEQSVQSKSKTANVTDDSDFENFFGDGKGVHEMQQQQSKLGDGAGHLNLSNSGGDTESSIFQNNENFGAFQTQTSDSLQGHEASSLFESVKPVEIASKSADDSSGWDAEFLSAGAGTLPQESKSFDPFIGSSVDLSTQMDSVFGSGKDFSVENVKDSSAASVSNRNDIWSFEDTGKIETENKSSSSNVGWDQGDLWQSTIKQTPDQKTTEEFDIWNDFASSNRAKTIPDTSLTDVTVNSQKNAEDVNDSDWIQSDGWQSSSSKAPENKTNYQESDSFDVWNDFTSSTIAQVPSVGFLEQSTIHLTPSVEQAPKVNINQNIGFGDLMEPDLFSGGFSNQESSTNVNAVESIASTSDRLGNDVGRNEGDPEDVGPGELSSGAGHSKTDDVVMLMSQMHDLSFMVDTNLSLPPENR